VKVRPARIARGGVVTVTGAHFGDDCLDTGTLPPGVGPLGNPLTGLAIVIDQGENEFVVATGSAGDDYSFRVDVVIPSELQPGPASLALLGAGDARLSTDLPLVISSAPPIRSGDAAVATFGPTTTVDTEPPGSLPPAVLPPDIPDDQVATVPPLSTTPVAHDGVQVGQQRAITFGIAAFVAIAAAAFAVWGWSKRRG
jgi:hypothetical protein